MKDLSLNVSSLRISSVSFNFFLAALRKFQFYFAVFT